MERLTYTDDELTEFEDLDCPVKANNRVNELCEKVCDEFQVNCPFKEFGKKLKIYEDKQEQGLLIELPVPLGTKVYMIEDVYEEIYHPSARSYMVVEATFDYEFIPVWGKWVFATQSEAE